MKTSLRTPPRYKRGGGVNSSEIERAQGKGIEFLESPRTYRGGRVFEDEHGLVRFRSAHGQARRYRFTQQLMMRSRAALQGQWAEGRSVWDAWARLRWGGLDRRGSDQSISRQLGRFGLIFRQEEGTKRRCGTGEDSALCVSFLPSALCVSFAGFLCFLCPASRFLFCLVVFNVFWFSY